MSNQQQPIESTNAPIVMITGCSSGIGLALTRLLIPTTYRVVVTARENSIHTIPSALQLPEDRFMLLPLDITKSAEREAVVREVQERWGNISILINNAGISYRSVVEHMTDSDELVQMHTNYFGPAGLVRLVIPGMRAQRGGKIINVSSVGGMMAMPTMGSYSASKFALEGFSESLWYELRPFNISVSLIQPGFINSESFRRVYYSLNAQRASKGNDPYYLYYEFMNRFIERMMTNAFATSESVAAIILRTMAKHDPPLRVPATMDAHLFSLMRRFLPRGLYHRILYWNLPALVNNRS